MIFWQTLSDWDAPSFALRVALGGIVVSTAVLLAARLLRRRSDPLRYGVLFAGVIGLLAVPLLVALGQHYQESIVSTAPVEIEVLKVPAEMLHDFLRQPDANDDAPAETSAIDDTMQWIATSLLGLWALGFVFGAVRLFVGLCKQRRALIGGHWHQPFWTAELKAQLAHKLGLRKFPEVRISPAAPMPMVIGVLRPTIVVPERVPASWQQAQWEAVLLHEAAHIARRDHWAALAQRVAVILFWWCPLVHLMARRLNELRESICDDCALQGQCDHIAYAELLVDSAERFLNLKPVPVPLGLLDSARGGLDARVLRLLEKERKPMIKLTLAGKLLGAGFLVAACLFTTAATAFSQAQAQPQKKVQIKILIDGKEIDLSELKIWDHVEGAPQKKQAAEKKEDVIKLRVKLADAADAKGVTISPDGKLIVSSDGKTITVFDAATGKIIAKHAQGGVTDHLLGKWTAKPDPRIEELVKQAEAIKPGSGAEIRKALQSAPRIHPAPVVTGARAVPQLPGVPATPGVRIIEAGDKKIIILTVEDAKGHQRIEADLKKIIERGIRTHVEEKIIEKKATKPAPSVDAIEVEFKAPVIGAKKVEDRKKTTAAPAQDIEALSRQLERITVELQDLRKRLDAQKK
jgi:beta-lactamase regulating signal transducer with metallopeptidase domain